MVKIVKRIFLTLLTLILVILITGVLFINLSPEFGTESEGMALKRMKNAPNYSDGASLWLPVPI